MCISGGGSPPIPQSIAPPPQLSPASSKLDLLLLGSQKRQRDLSLTGRPLFGRDILKTSLGLSNQPGPQLGGI